MYGAICFFFFFIRHWSLILRLEDVHHVLSSLSVKYLVQSVTIFNFFVNRKKKKKSIDCLIEELGIRKSRVSPIVLSHLLKLYLEEKGKATKIHI